jgi:hypothetical protein
MQGTTYLMRAEGQQLQYGNYVSQFSFVQRKVLLLVCVAFRICVCDIKMGGERAVNTWSPSQRRKRKKKGGGKGEREENNQNQDAPGLRRNQKSHMDTSAKSLYGGQEFSPISSLANDAPFSANQNARSQSSKCAYSRNCRSFFPSFSSIITYPVQSISCNALIPSSVISSPPPPPPSEFFFFFLLLLFLLLLSPLLVVVVSVNSPTVHPTLARNLASCTHLLRNSAANFRAVAAPEPSLRTSAAVSNLHEKMREWRCGFDALERAAFSRRLTSRSGASSLGGPTGLLATA